MTIRINGDTDIFAKLTFSFLSRQGTLIVELLVRIDSLPS